MVDRRGFVHCSLCASGAWLLGCGDDDTPRDGGFDTGTDGGFDAAGDAPFDGGTDSGPTCDDVFAGGTMRRVVPFVGNDRAFHVRTGAGWDGRLLTDLSVIPEQPVIPNENFYLRTFDPDLLDRSRAWEVAVGGLVDAESTLSIDDLLRPGVRDFGVHVLECSGNGGPAFGLMSAARWGGVPVMDVLDALPIDARATGVEVIGFDEHSVPSVGGHSTPGASWIFTFEQLAGAFFATEMNGLPLPEDHGAPVRLYVPNWYGCSCIKWVNGLRFVDASEPSTGQMREFASRTHQLGVPDLAVDFLPASMDQAAMPVRVEEWEVDGATVYRAQGILWGGDEPTDALVFDWGAGEQRVEVCPPQSMNATWTVWQTAWRPAAPGEYAIRMRIDDDAIRTRRLDTGFYARSVQVDVV